MALLLDWSVLLEGIHDSGSRSTLITKCLVSNGAPLFIIGPFSLPGASVPLWPLPGLRSLMRVAWTCTRIAGRTDHGFATCNFLGGIGRRWHGPQ